MTEMWRSNANELKQRHWSITQADGTTVNDKKHQTVNLHKSRMGVKKQATRNKPDRNEHLFLNSQVSKDYNQPQPPSLIPNQSCTIITQVNIPLSTPAHVETAHAKLKNHFTRIHQHGD